FRARLRAFRLAACRTRFLADRECATGQSSPAKVEHRRTLRRRRRGLYPLAVTCPAGQQNRVARFCRSSRHELIDTALLSVGCLFLVEERELVLLGFLQKRVLRNFLV